MNDFLYGYLDARYAELEAQLPPEECMGSLYQPINQAAYAAGMAAKRTPELDDLVWPGVGPMVLIGSGGTRAVLHRLS